MDEDNHIVRNAIVCIKGILVRLEKDWNDFHKESFYVEMNVDYYLREIEEQLKKIRSVMS